MTPVRVEFACVSIGFTVLLVGHVVQPALRPHHTFSDLAEIDAPLTASRATALLLGQVGKTVCDPCPAVALRQRCIEQRSDGGMGLYTEQI